MKDQIRSLKSEKDHFQETLETMKSDNEKNEHATQQLKEKKKRDLKKKTINELKDELKKLTEHFDNEQAIQQKEIEKLKKNELSDTQNEYRKVRLSDQEARETLSKLLGSIPQNDYRI